MFAWCNSVADLIDFFFVFLFVGVDDIVHMSEDAGEVGITGEITAVSPPPRPSAGAGSSVGIGSLSSEVADFLKEFDRKALVSLQNVVI